MTRWPTIVAESLLDVGDPLETALDPGAPCPAASVVRSMARSVAPTEAEAEAPPWLRPDQAIQFRRAVAAVRRHGGVLIADPTGSGKSWIALAAARELAVGRAVAVAAPAILRPQWDALAARTQITIGFSSHEAVSRGRLPDDRSDVLILDECHRFRAPTTRRYRSLAPWLVGRRGILLSATPLVNRLEDLAHQLLLVLRDDTLAGRGCPSLRAALAGRAPPPSLGEVVLQREGADGIPLAVHRRVRIPAPSGVGPLLRRIDRLRLSPHNGIAALLRLGLCHAWASSTEALAAWLQRYLRLLDHARDAVAAGQPLPRSVIRGLTAGDPDQVLMWEVMGSAGGALDLELNEREAAAALLRSTREPRVAALSKRRLACLRQLLADRTPSVVFTNSRDTLGWLRTGLGDHGPAWVTGDDAGIGAFRLPRPAVLGWFGPGARPPAGLKAPHLLLATDVASEGLDLQRAHRVVHFDLPWTAVRLEQRAGRARRLGAAAATVEIVTLHPPVLLERRIRQLERLAAKRGLRREAGLDHEAPWLFRWRSDLAAWAGQGAVHPGYAVVGGGDPGWLVGVQVTPAGEAAAPAVLFWFGEDGLETDDAHVVVPRLLAAERSRPATGDLEWPRLRPRLAGAIHRVLTRAAGAAWGSPAGRGRHREVLRRLDRLARAALAARDLARLGRVERALAALAGGLTAGEAARVEAAATLDDDRLLQALGTIPSRRPSVQPPRPAITGIVRVASFPACARSEPCFSTSTGPSSTRSS